MEQIIAFVGENYVWFLVITILLLFALIGYVYDSKKTTNDLFAKEERKIEEEQLENIVVPEGKSLSDMVTVSKNINAETHSVNVDDIVNMKEANKPVEHAVEPVQPAPVQPQPQVVPVQPQPAQAIPVEQPQASIQPTVLGETK